MIALAMLMEADASPEEAIQFLVEYREKMAEVLAQIEPQVAADMALLVTKPEGTA